MNILKQNRTVVLTWRRECHEDIAKAQQFFTELTHQGWIATTSSNGIQRIFKFTKDCEKIVFYPLSEGG
ncbi:MAG: hypothetical protein JSV76_03910 [Candidatus Bathyarchaeota archaeon]|nr:MAG: hypothetical protein JSV76_03910 [Candidatus Bathyarchaeota archaeon]